MKTIIIIKSLFILCLFMFFVSCTKDQNPPEILLIKGNYIKHPLNKEFIDPGYVAEDDKSGVITADVIVSGSVNVDSAGVYQLKYFIEDAAGNSTTKSRYIEVFNEASVYQGWYQVTQFQPDSLIYHDSLFTSNVTNNMMFALNFNNISEANTSIEFSDTGIVIPEQNITISEQGLSFHISGSGVFIDSTIFQIDYVKSYQGIVLEYSVIYNRIP